MKWDTYKTRAIELALNLAPLALALVFTTALLIATGAPPFEAYTRIVEGAFGSVSKFSDVLIAVVPLLLCAAGLLITFTAGQWNIGIEGQIIAGAIATTWFARAFDLPPLIYLPLLFFAGALAGALWATLAGMLKVYGKVHEIFGGLGLNFIASGIVLYLIFGPWKQPGIASMSGTEFFRKSAWLPTLGEFEISPLALAVALLALALVYFSLRSTRWGLELKAVGKNLRAAYWLGIPTNRRLLGAFALCGACAGIAGATQALGVYHRLLPAISSGYGYLAILVVLLTGFRAVWILPVAIFFAAVVKGSLQLPLAMQLDSSLGGVLQGALVLAVLLFQGVRARWSK